jgi:hypothetical protein
MHYCRCQEKPKCKSKEATYDLPQDNGYELMICPTQLADSIPNGLIL